LVQSRFDYRSGFLLSDGNYHLFTNDGGEHWYAIDEDRVIIGPADPGLLRHLAAWDAIIRQAEANGSLTLESSQDIELLEEAGFSVEVSR